MACASLAAGADALLIEVHPDPDHALSDGAQSMFPQQFAELMNQLRMIAPAVGQNDRVSEDRVRLRHGGRRSDTDEFRKGQLKNTEESRHRE